MKIDRETQYNIVGASIAFILVSLITIVILGNKKLSDIR